MPDLSVKLIVIYSTNIDKLRKFYESLGLNFVEEKHGDGALHYSSNIDTIIFEIYPTKKEVKAKEVIGFSMPNLDDFVSKFPDYILRAISEEKHFILRDPDGRLVFLYEK